MKRTTWTDRRVDDLSEKVDKGFERVDREIRDLRIETREGFVEVRREIDGLRSLMLRMNAAIIATVVAAALLHGI